MVIVNSFEADCLSNLGKTLGGWRSLQLFELPWLSTQERCM